MIRSLTLATSLQFSNGTCSIKCSGKPVCAPIPSLDKPPKRSQVEAFTSLVFSIWAKHHYTLHRYVCVLLLLGLLLLLFVFSMQGQPVRLGFCLTSLSLSIKDQSITQSLRSVPLI